MDIREKVVYSKGSEALAQGALSLETFKVRLDETEHLTVGVPAHC